jgi:hypothetical protein
MRLRLVELIVVAVLLAGATGVALPAVYQAGKKSDRNEALNNLKQLAIAVHCAHDVYNKFPQIAGKLGDKEGTLHFHLLPFLEQTPLYKRGEVNVALPIMTSPGDRSAVATGVYKKSFGVTNYAGNWLVFKGGPQAPEYGKITQIVDGTSNTLMLAERYQMCNGTPCLWGYNQFFYWAPMFAYYSQGKFQVAPTQERCDPALPQSILRDGIAVAYCDGSTRVLANNLDPNVWALIACPNDGMPIPGDF